jgi:hypothetical protein
MRFQTLPWSCETHVAPGLGAAAPGCDMVTAYSHPGGPR